MDEGTGWGERVGDLRPPNMIPGRGLGWVGWWVMKGGGVDKRGFDIGSWRFLGGGRAGRVGLLVFAGVEGWRETSVFLW